jgi:DNA-directed RNA polymerase specialized sigma24 family protein
MIDFQRRRRRPGEGKSDTSDLEGSLDKDPSAPENQETVTTAIELKELRRSGIRAWADLEARDRKLMCDKLHRDMSNETLAGRMQLTAGALRTAISRAQVRLLSQLRELAPEYFPDRV